MNVTKDIEVIQFTDEILRDCINYNFFGKKSEWNPEGKILLYPIEKYTELSSEIKLYTTPRIQFNGESTFLRDPNNNDMFIPSNIYKDVVVANRDSAIIEILEHLGVTEYYVNTHVKGDAQMGGGKETNINTKVDAAENGSDGFNAASKQNGRAGLNGRFDKIHKLSFDNSSYKLTEDSWSHACAIAKQYGLDKEKDINNLLIARRPGSQDSKSILTSSFSSISIGAGLNANLNIAKSLSLLAGMPGIASVDCGLSKLLNFQMEMNIEYESIIIYNFSSEPIVDKMLEQYNN